MLKFNLSLYTNQFVKIVLEKNNEIPYVYGNLIAYLMYDEKIKQYILNHPYDIKKKFCLAGEAAFNPNDVKSIVPATMAERTNWVGEYIKFHKEVIKEKGSDPCTLHLSIEDIIPGFDLKFKGK